MLQRNRIHTLPASIGELQSINQLDLSFNHLEKTPTFNMPVRYTVLFLQDL
jgi:Leucine-rich repeat (LRR) protein